MGISIAQVFGKPEFFAESYANFKAIVSGLTGSSYKFRYAEFSGSVVEMWCEMAGGVITYRIEGDPEYTTFQSDKANVDAQKPHQTPIGVVDSGGNLIPLQLDASGRIPVSETFEPHADDHLQTGADPLQVGVPVEISDATNAEGTAADYARRDHVHAHGNRGGGALHSAATTAEAGFLSASDKTKLDSLTKDHGSLDGLADDDHVQYLLADGSRALAGNWDIAGHQLLNPVIHVVSSLPTSPADWQVVLYTSAEYRCLMLWDPNRSKWVSLTGANFAYGHSAADGNYLHTVGLASGSPGNGYVMPVDCVLTRVAAFVRTGQVSKTFHVRRNGDVTNLFSFTTDAAGQYINNNVNVDLDSGDVVAVFVDPAGNTATDVSIWLEMRWRA